VIWRTARETPVQGICMKVKSGKLLLGEEDFDDLVLWRDTAPDETVFVCRAKKKAELCVWNCWRDDRGVMQAWIGNAGMRLSESGSNTIRVESNSRSEVTFRIWRSTWYSMSHESAARSACQHVRRLTGPSRVSSVLVIRAAIEAAACDRARGGDRGTEQQRPRRARNVRPRCIARRRAVAGRLDDGGRAPNAVEYRPCIRSSCSSSARSACRSSCHC
jgi:hypothetical protein